MKCPRCAQENPPQAKFCLECGTPVRPSGASRPRAELHAQVEQLRRELQQKNEALIQAEVHASQILEQQTATSEILRAISSSPIEVQPVLNVIARSAVRLCDGHHASLFRFDGALQHFVAHYGVEPATLDALQRRYPRPPDVSTVTGRAIVECRVIHVPDLTVDHGFAESQVITAAAGYRAVLAVPMFRESRPLGVILVVRKERRPFTDEHIALVQTFADQAVIAIENVRLLRELQEKNTALTSAHAQVTEALDQQTATAEILRVISSSPRDIQPVFETILTHATRLCAAERGIAFTWDGEHVVAVACRGLSPEAEAEFRVIRKVTPSSGLGRMLASRRPVQVEDVTDDPAVQAGDPLRRRTVRLLGARTAMWLPLLKGDEVLGALAIYRQEVRRFNDKQIELVQTFADQAVIAVENVRLFRELEQKNEALTDALDRQTATADILRVISSSATDVRPVFDAILKAAARLCEAHIGGVYRYDGHDIHFVSHHNFSEAGQLMLRAAFPAPPSERTSIGRAVLQRGVVHVRNLRTDPDAPLGDVRFAAVEPHSSVLAVPMLRDGEPLGVMALSRGNAPFSDQHISLVQTFADQAVIAIENDRLFKELKEKNRALTEALEQQTATSEILRVISSSPTDVQPVFEAIAENAARLVQAWSVTVLRWDGRLIHLVAERGGPAGSGQRLRDESPWLPNMTSGPGRCIATGTIIHVPDVDLDPEADAATRELARNRGWRSELNVPMLRDGSPIGAISVTRVEAGPFSLAEIELLRTFADQAVIAIENVRLFNEVEAANRDLKAASQHKSEFLANMSHELRTPLNAVIGFSEVLRDRMFGDLNEKQDEYLNDIHASGQHLLSLINDILDLSKIEAGRMELEVTDFHLPAALDNALTLVRERAGRRGIVLHATVDDDIEHIRADERKIKQVLLNLLSNAIKFTPEGGRIDVRAVAADEMVEVSVSDTGVGIALEDQEAIFEEFRQVGTTAKKVEGTGLGLALSRKFIELHGGRIWVQSQVGVGSIFTFTIPAVHTG